MFKIFFNNFSWKRVWVVVIIFVALCSVFLTSVFVYAYNYQDKVLPGVYLGGVYIGGMDKTTLSGYLQDMNSKLLNEGIHFSFSLDDEKKDFVLYPTIIGGEDVRDLIQLNINDEVDSLIAYRKNNNLLSDTVTAILVMMSKPDISLSYVKLDKNGIFDQIHNYLLGYITEPVNASVKINSLKPLDYKIVSSTEGFSFDYDMVSGQILKSWSNFQVPYIKIVSAVKLPTINENDVSKIVGRLQNIFDNGPLTISYVDPYTTLKHSWSITTDMMSSWLEIQRDADNNLVFVLNSVSTTDFLSNKIGPEVNVQAQDAKFQIGDNGKVIEFSGSRPGVAVDIDATLQAIDKAFTSRTLYDEGIVKNINLINKQTEPKIKTGDVNDLGISEILGVGHSKFIGSPANRIKNIKHAVMDKLDGLLIKPDENFSLVQTLEPFTIADGYYPELVIKGDQELPEIAGGLCQVGTTMFRAAMNSGLKITERKNHSLVVSYYNDLTNGNPGTDATIYQPRPDFRFLNDTGHNILLTVEMNTKTADLYIYFWGTSDGRKGSYSLPIVSRWIPAPAGDQRIETTGLPPGKITCQPKFNGAETSFTYTRILADGTKEDRVFESYYRPLSKICLVGIDPNKPAEVNPPVETGSSTINTPSSTPLDTIDPVAN
ncbi:MAG: VanW family protein [Candidatus Magasanikbacteria bacterium]